MHARRDKRTKQLVASVVVVAALGVTLVAVHRRSDADGGGPGQRPWTLTVRHERTKTVTYTDVESVKSERQTWTLDGTASVNVPTTFAVAGDPELVSLSFRAQDDPGRVKLALKNGPRDVGIDAIGTLVSLSGHAAYTGHTDVRRSCCCPPGEYTSSDAQQASGELSNRAGEFTIHIERRNLPRNKLGLRLSSGPLAATARKELRNSCAEGNQPRSSDFAYDPGERTIDASWRGSAPECTGHVERTPRGYVGTLQCSRHEVSSAAVFPRSDSQLIETTSFDLAIEEEQLVVKIVSPEPDSRHVFGTKDPGVLQIRAEAKVVPEKYASDVEWDVDAVEDSKRTIEPKRGNKVTIRFEGLPERNDQFGPKTITAKVRGKQDRVTVKLLFRRDGQDHPGERFVSPIRTISTKSVKEPNWVYYWKQTASASGHAAAILYGKGLARCDKQEIFGFYDFGDAIYVCDPARLDDTNLITGRHTEGIDMFAVTVLHEWKHKLNYEQWWPPPAGYAKVQDRDKDSAPDSAEPGLQPVMNPKKFSTHRFQKGQGDEHYFAWIEESKWRNGAADREDWACPGKQCRGR